MNVLLKPLLWLLTVLLVGALILVGLQRAHIGTLNSQVAAATAKVDQAQAQSIASQFEASGARLNVATVTRFVDRVIHVRDTTHDLQLKVPTYVPPSTDRAFPLPVGFVRLHDAAATGVPELPGAGAADAEASDVATSQALGVIIGNYGTCHEVREQLSALQDWERQREALDADFQRELVRNYNAMKAGSP